MFYPSAFENSYALTRLLLYHVWIRTNWLNFPILLSFCPSSSVISSFGAVCVQNCNHSGHPYIWVISVSGSSSFSISEAKRKEEKRI